MIGDISNQSPRVYRSNDRCSPALRRFALAPSSAEEGDSDGQPLLGRQALWLVVAARRRASRQGRAAPAQAEAEGRSAPKSQSQSTCLSDLPSRREASTAHE